MELLQRYAKVKQLLNKYNQSHLLAFWSELNEKQQHNLLTQIEQLEFDRIGEKVERYVKNPASSGLPEDFSAAPAYPALPQTTEQKEKYSRAKQLGAELISNGEVA